MKEKEKKVVRTTQFVDEANNSVETVTVYEDGSSTSSKIKLVQDKPIVEPVIAEPCKTCKV